MGKQLKTTKKATKKTKATKEATKKKARTTTTPRTQQKKEGEDKATKDLQDFFDSLVKDNKGDNRKWWGQFTYTPEMFDALEDACRSMRLNRGDLARLALLTFIDFKGFIPYAPKK